MALALSIWAAALKVSASLLVGTLLAQSNVKLASLWTVMLVLQQFESWWFLSCS